MIGVCSVGSASGSVFAAGKRKHHRRPGRGRGVAIAPSRHSRFERLGRLRIERWAGRLKDLSLCCPALGTLLIAGNSIAA